MTEKGSTYLKKVLSIAALLLSLAALQSPLWRPEAATRSVTAKAGGSVTVPYDGQLDKAVIFRRRMATLSAGSPGQLVIHAHAPGKTSMLIRYKDGDSVLYEVIVLPG